jgi:solute carrier family 25 (mitochondrial S-adenosylmethionine transporter), member 26
LVSLTAGAVAGFCVDVALFPLDTIKTRLQSPQGFINSGGFRGVYQGLSAVGPDLISSTRHYINFARPQAAGGSMPGAGLFFCTYETMKPIAQSTLEGNPAVAQMLSASVAETVACLVRVPTEVCLWSSLCAKSHNLQMGFWYLVTGISVCFKVVKQRMQIGAFNSALSAVPSIVKAEGVAGLYRGFGITILREIPFSAIQVEKVPFAYLEMSRPLSPWVHAYVVQFPIYEALKASWASRQGLKECSSLQAAACGSFAGAVAAAATTPLDVVKTRLMLGADKHHIP